jgi:hypothetical protein
MNVVGDYRANGYAHVHGLVPPEVTSALLASLKRDVASGPIQLSKARSISNLLTGPAFEIYGHHYVPMNAFLWGLTPTMRELTGKDLLPTYAYLRIYREGDICRVHYDRPSCEHSLSLTLDYSDGVVWPLELGERHCPQPNASVSDDFGDEPYATILMNVGDAVMYRGTNHRHGRITLNPNAWSAHLFLHWVERNGIYADHAFDQRTPETVNFTFT